jgi:hypothetical protein
MMNNLNIRIRPSSVDTFMQCAQQWYRVFIMGDTSIPSARAAIGTAIHKGIEVFWNDAMEHQEKDPNLGMMSDAAIEAFKEEGQKGLQYDEGENKDTASEEIVKGMGAFISDIVPFAQIPDGVEKFFSVPITGHPIVAEVGGTVDYIRKNTISDVKTSKRTPTPSNYDTQQGLYRYLARANNIPVEQNLIHGIVLTQKPKGVILEMPVNVEKAVTAVNSILDTTRVFASDIVHPDVLFRGNPKYYLCDPKYCAFYHNCKFVKGEAVTKPVQQPKL